MATDTGPQRAWRAACPNCGAPVEFRSPASAFAVCSFCRSSVVRDGDALRRIGQAADLFDDHSPLQIGASGSFMGRRFTLVGRLQYRSAQGTWNEWHALFDPDPAGDPAQPPRPAWLSEDNGRYVLAFDAALPDAPPPLEQLQVGQPATMGGVGWTVASVVRATLLAADGELPVPPASGREFTVVDLRNAQGEVATLDDSAAPPRWSVGRSVILAELALRGLVDASERTLQGRSFECPNCGAPLQARLDGTKSIVCDACKAVVDVSAGVGGELRHYVQRGGPPGGGPRIPLGSSGRFAFGGGPPQPWQVVGFVVRIELPNDAGERPVPWREYLLYNRSAGFTFLVDAEDGWSWVAPITGVPTKEGAGVRHDGISYRRLFDYRARVAYVLGEFYWRLERDQITDNSDFAGTGKRANQRLNRERSVEAGVEEIVWSAGETIPAELVRTGFGLPADAAAGIRRDARPTSLAASGLLAKGFFVLFVIVVLLMLFRCGSDDGCDELRSSYGAASQEYQSCVRRSGSRTGGGAFGGFSSGGFHK